MFRSSSSLSDVMESFQEQLNLQDVDELADRLRFVYLCISRISCLVRLIPIIIIIIIINFSLPQNYVCYFIMVT